MKTNILFSALFAAFLLLLSKPVNVYAQQSRPEIKDNFTSQEAREMEKFKSSGIKQRTMFAKLVLSKDKPPTIVEELYLDKKGLMVEKKRYNDSGLDFIYRFKYNSKGKVIEKTTRDADGVLFEREKSKLNKAGNPTEVNLETMTRKGMIKTKKIVKYDKNNLIIQVDVYDANNKLSLIEKYDYKEGLMISTKAYSPKGVMLGSEEYEYDARKNKIKETVTSFNPVVNKDTTKAAVDPKVMESKSEYILKYDDRGFIAEVDAPMYKQVFTVNEKGDFVRDIVYDGRTNAKQNDNGFEYNEKGFLDRITRYYPDGKPGAYITYTYEFYDKTKAKK